MEINNISEKFSTNFFPNTTQNPLPEYVLPFNNQWIIASTTILVIFFVFGVAANSLTIAAIYFAPNLRNQYNYFLASVCVSDIISAFVSILFLYRRIWGFSYFAWPKILCKLYWGIDFWTTFATAFHIVSYATLRLIGVRWPSTFRRISMNTVKIWLACIWIVTFLGGFIPHFIFNTVNTIDRENDKLRARWASCSLSKYWFSTWQVYAQIGYIIFLYLPAIAIIIISITISVILWKKRFIPGENNIESKINAKKHDKVIFSASEKRWNKRKRIVYQLFLIVFSFLFGYIPLTVFHYFTGFAIDTTTTETNAADWRFAMIQYMMLRFSECLNPIFYNAASSKIRRETVKMLKKSFITRETTQIVANT